MNDKTLNLILNINRKFYQLTQEEFSKTRQNFMPGWGRVVEFFEAADADNISVFDIGCGNGRFYEFLKRNLMPGFTYLGVDVNSYFIDEARKKYGHALFKKTDFLKGKLPTKSFSHIVVFGVMHHIPSKELRTKWLNAVSGLLKSKGYLVLTFWQLDKSKAITPEVFDSEELEAGDMFLGWGGSRKPVRYCHFFDDSELKELVHNLEINDVILVDKFEADGKNNRSNKYLIFQKK